MISFKLISKLPNYKTIIGLRSMSQNEIINIGATFSEHFEIVPALSEELKNEAFRVRHQVYCEDLNYESQRASKYETDEYDINALHLLMKSVRLNKFIGCTRLIRPSTDDPYQLLPFEKCCGSTLDYSKVGSLLLSRNKIAEVSRLAVISEFRRRKGESERPINLSDEDYGISNHAHFRFPYIPLGLFIGTVELAYIHNIDILFMLTEKKLAMHFSKLGANLDFIGIPIEHRGVRIPSMVNTLEIIKNMKPMFRPLYNLISKVIYESYSRSNQNPFIIQKNPAFSNTTNQQLSC